MAAPVQAQTLDISKNDMVNGQNAVSSREQPLDISKVIRLMDRMPYQAEK